MFPLPSASAAVRLDPVRPSCSAAVPPAGPTAAVRTGTGGAPPERMVSPPLHATCRSPASAVTASVTARPPPAPGPAVSAAPSGSGSVPCAAAGSPASSRTALTRLATRSGSRPWPASARPSHPAGSATSPVGSRTVAVAPLPSSRPRKSRTGSSLAWSRSRTAPIRSRASTPANIAAAAGSRPVTDEPLGSGHSDRSAWARPPRCRPTAGPDGPAEIRSCGLPAGPGCPLGPSVTDPLHCPFASIPPSAVTVSPPASASSVADTRSAAVGTPRSTPSVTAPTVTAAWLAVLVVSANACRSAAATAARAEAGESTPRSCPAGSAMSLVTALTDSPTAGAATAGSVRPAASSSATTPAS